MELTAEVKAILPEVEALARELHAMPEISFEEYKTTALVEKYCRECGVEILDIGLKTGVVAWLNCGREDTVALRADIDAVLQDDGSCAHVCGHDYHTAGLIGAMKILSAKKEELRHNVLFIFQPAEEFTKGADYVLSCGLMDKLPQKPTVLFGTHNRPELPLGTIGVKSGGLMAENTTFEIDIHGRTGHPGAPNQCIDPIVAAAAVINGAQTIVSRNCDPFEPCVCSVCSVNSGNKENFAPEIAELSGSIRTLSHEAHLLIIQRLKALTEESAKAYNCTSEIRLRREVPAVFNGPRETAMARAAAEATVGRDNVVDPRACLASEDFAVFGEVMPAFLYWIGAGVEGEVNHPWHHADFRVPAGYLEISVRLFVNSVLVN